MTPPTEPQSRSDLSAWKAEIRSFCAEIREELEAFHDLPAAALVPDVLAAGTLPEASPQNDSPRPAVTDRQAGDSQRMGDVPDRLELLKQRLAERINLEFPPTSQPQEADLNDDASD